MLNSVKLSKYGGAFDSIDKTLIVLSAKTGSVSIISFTTFIAAPVKLASGSFTLIFYLITKMIQKITEYNKK